MKRNPVICGYNRIFSANGSIIRLKSVGDSGHPCLVPLDMLNGLESKLALYTWASGEEYSAKTADKIIT